MRFQPKLVILSGLIACLALMRTAEYLIDTHLGNGDGFITTSLPAFGFAACYQILYNAIVIWSILTVRLDQKRLRCHVLIVALVSAGVWLVFYPANMSYDSLGQYAQAVTRQYDDWHPPLMSLILTGILQWGGNIAILMLIQCVLGGLGIYMLASRIVGMAGISKREASCLALIVFGFLLSPISPLAFYLMTFWKDSRCAIFLLWSMTIALILFQKARVFSPVTFASWYGAFMGLSVLMLLTRHNALAVLPSVILLAWVILRSGRQCSVLSAGLVSMSLIVVYIGAYKGQYRFFPIEPRHPEEQVIALDLAGMIVHTPALRRALPDIGQHLVEGYARAYQYGNMIPL